VENPSKVDNTPDGKQCTSETEGGFAMETVGGIADLALAGGTSLGADDEGESSGSGLPSTKNKVSVLLDSVVVGVNFETGSELTRLTDASEELVY
jgi:hypothetical protein